MEHINQFVSNEIFETREFIQIRSLMVQRYNIEKSKSKS